MCAAWKKKNERKKIVCFYSTKPDILLCGIARFSRENKNKLRTFQPQKWKKIKNSQPQTKFTGPYKKKECNNNSKNNNKSNVSENSCEAFVLTWIVSRASMDSPFTILNSKLGGFPVYI